MKKGTLSEKGEAALRSKLIGHIHNIQSNLIEAKAKYRASGDIGNMQMVTDFILASERRINDIDSTDSVPKYYK